MSRGIAPPAHVRMPPGDYNENWAKCFDALAYVIQRTNSRIALIESDYSMEGVVTILQVRGLEIDPVMSPSGDVVPYDESDSPQRTSRDAHQLLQLLCGPGSDWRAKVIPFDFLDWQDTDSGAGHMFFRVPYNVLREGSNNGATYWFHGNPAMHHHEPEALNPPSICNLSVAVDCAIPWDGGWPRIADAALACAALAFSSLRIDHAAEVVGSSALQREAPKCSPT